MTYGEPTWAYGQILVGYGGGDVVVIPDLITGSTADTTDIINLTNGVRRRIDCFAFDVVDVVGNVLGQVHPVRSGSPVKIENQTTRTVFRTMTNFNLDATEQIDIDTSRDRIRPSLVLQDGAKFPLGVFLFGDATRPIHGWGLELDASLQDQRYILDQAVGRTVGLQIGALAIDSAVKIATEVFGGLISVVPSSIALSQPLGWKISDTRLKIIEDLCTLAGYLPPYYSNGGTLVFRPVPSPPLTANIDPYESNTRILKDTIVETDDLLRAPNRYIAIDSGTSTNPVVGEYDIPASAPNSETARGFPVVQTLTVQGLTDVPAANQAAQAAALSDPNQFRQVQFGSTHDPRHDTFDIITYLGNAYRELSWAVDLRSGGTMSHDLRRVYL